MTPHRCLWEARWKKCNIFFHNYVKIQHKQMQHVLTLSNRCSINKGNTSFPSWNIISQHMVGNNYSGKQRERQQRYTLWRHTALLPPYHHWSDLCPSTKLQLLLHHLSISFINRIRAPVISSPLSITSIKEAKFPCYESFFKAHFMFRQQFFSLVVESTFFITLSGKKTQTIS